MAHLREHAKGLIEELSIDRCSGWGLTRLTWSVESGEHARRWPQTGSGPKYMYSVHMSVRLVQLTKSKTSFTICRYYISTVYKCGVQLNAPTSPCSIRTPWSGVPYTVMHSWYLVDLHSVTYGSSYGWLYTVRYSTHPYR